MSTNAGLYNFIIIIILIALIYFMMIRPQRKRDKEVKDMRESLRPGDEIVTVGGIIGKVVRIKDERVIIESGSSKVKIEILKSAVGNVIGKSQKPAEPKKEEKKEEEQKEEKEPRSLSRNRKVTPKKLTPKKAEDGKQDEADADKAE
jgi:preprotein translocase subunit YajC